VPIVENCAVYPMMPLRRCHEFGVGLDRGALVGAGGLSHFIVALRGGAIDRPGADSPVGLSC
jgi:hypothetical protein